MPEPVEEEPEMSEQVAERVEMHTVKVWFGEHVIASYCAEADLAERYAHAMSRRFAGLRVTNDLVPPAGEPKPKPNLPGERLWGIPPA